MWSEHNRVAGAGCTTTQCGQTELIDHVAGSLVIDSNQRGIDHLDIMIGTNIADGVGRIEEGVALTVEDEDGVSKSEADGGGGIQLHVQQRVAVTGDINIGRGLAGMIHARIDFTVEVGSMTTGGKSRAAAVNTG